MQQLIVLFFRKYYKKCNLGPFFYHIPKIGLQTGPQLVRCVQKQTTAQEICRMLNGRNEN